MRPLNLVIEAIRKEIEKHEVENKSEILTKLFLIENKCNFSDLSLNNHLWIETSSVLNPMLENVDGEWKRKVVDLYSGRENYINYL